MQLTLAKKVLILVAVPLVFELGVVSGVAYLFHQAEQERAREVHSIAVTKSLNRLLRLLLERSFTHTLKSVSGSDEFGKAFKGAAVDMKAEINELRKLCTDDPVEMASLNEIARIADEANLNLVEARNALEAEDRVETMRSWIKVRKGLNKLYKLCDETIAHQVWLQEREAEGQARTRKGIESLLFFAAVFNVALALVLSMLFNRDTTDRLKLLMQNTVRLASNEPLGPQLRGGDEMAVLDRFFRDMAQALEEARRKERAVVDNVLDVICSIDETGKFSAVNPASEALWSFAPDELIGKRISSIVPSEFANQVAAILAGIKENQSAHSFECPVRRHDGSTVEMLWTVHWSSEEREFFCVAHDISERKKLERLKRDFIAMVSHDLKTPLTSIQMVHSLLAANAFGELNEEGHESLDIADENVSRLIKLVNDLLDVERIESGELDLNRVPCPISSVVTSAVQGVLAIAEKDGIAINTSVLKPDLSVQIDRDRITQVLVNLIGNAIKFSQPGQTIEVGIKRLETEVVIEVKDSGRGIAADQLELIFERFKQTDAIEDRKKGGTGLGLAICKAIVERHHGRIGVDSEAGKGSLFWFRLPIES
ncbi:MAG: ATP-binding protein [Candidatus Melainabacteria bacterium]|nr:ATP-binding protein [Candidatus Melainabacteria bacterium]